MEDEILTKVVGTLIKQVWLARRGKQRIELKVVNEEQTVVLTLSAEGEISIRQHAEI